MTPGEFYSTVLGPGLIWCSAIMPGLNTPEAARWLLAVAKQESGLTDRRQIGGPARGFYQFEISGVAGVLSHDASKASARAACAMATVVPAPANVLGAIEGHDWLATTFARLLLFTDPAPVPGDVLAGWNIYNRLWRPGKPRSDVWAANWTDATSVIYGGHG